MDTEQRKLYNQQYYSTHKKRISEMLLKKVECPLCNRTITHANLQRHQTTPLCLRNRGKDDKSELEQMKQQINKLTQEMNQLKAPST
jgi:hypothetical protein